MRKSSLITLAVVLLCLAVVRSLHTAAVPYKTSVGVQRADDKKLAVKKQWKEAAIQVRIQIQNNFKADEQVIYVDRKWLEEVLTYLIED